MTRLVTKLLPLLGLIGTVAQAAGPGVYGKGFPTAVAAANALLQAAEADNTAELIAILGPSSKDVLSTSDVSADQKVRREFVTKAKQRMTLIPRRGRQNEMTLVAGKDNWPLPIPLINVSGRWYFDMPNGEAKYKLIADGNAVDEWTANDHLPARKLDGDASTRRRR